MERFKNHAKHIRHLHVTHVDEEEMTFPWDGLENLRAVGLPLIPRLESLIFRDPYSSIRNPDLDRSLFLLLLTPTIETLQLEFHDFATDTWQFSDAFEVFQKAFEEKANLKEVYLRFTPDDDTDELPHIEATSLVTAMIPFTNLVSLSITSCAISPDSLQALGHLRITFLCILWAPVFAHEWDDLPALEGGLPCLTVLQVENIPFRSLRGLFSCSGLVNHILELNIGFRQYTPATEGLSSALQCFVAHAKGLRGFTLNYLNACCATIGYQALRPLSESPLQRLALYRCNVKVKNLARFIVTSWPELESFVAPNIEISFKNLLEFAKGLRIHHLHFIVFLDISTVNSHMDSDRSAQTLSLHGVMDLGRGAETNTQLLKQVAQ